jgi:2-amino-4-hydroxy-6-hydroxymethyldihydropteridine diphosphokinase
VARVYLGLGSNLGDRAANLREAARRLAEKVTLLRVSSLYETEPWGVTDQPKFLNAACAADTGLSPQELLQFTQSIELDLGRVRSARWGPREIDIDILLYDDLVIETRDLTVPHPRLRERAFVLVPLVEIAPEMIHPGNRQSMQDLMARCEDAQAVRFLGQLK